MFGRTEAALARYLHHVKGKEKVRVVCIDLSSTYRALVTKHFRNALIVTDRFHVIRLIAQQFLTAWRHIDPEASLEPWARVAHAAPRRKSHAAAEWQACPLLWPAALIRSVRCPEGTPPSGQSAFCNPSLRRSNLSEWKILPRLPVGMSAQNDRSDGENLAIDGHSQFPAVREVRLAQLARLMLFCKEHFPRWPSVAHQ